MLEISTLQCLVAAVCPLSSVLQDTHSGIRFEEHRLQKAQPPWRVARPKARPALDTTPSSTPAERNPDVPKCPATTSTTVPPGMPKCPATTSTTVPRVNVLGARGKAAAPPPTTPATYSALVCNIFLFGEEGVPRSQLFFCTYIDCQH